MISIKILQAFKSLLFVVLYITFKVFKVLLDCFNNIPGQSKVVILNEFEITYGSKPSMQVAQRAQYEIKSFSHLLDERVFLAIEIIKDLFPGQSSFYIFEANQIKRIDVNWMILNLDDQDVNSENQLAMTMKRVLAQALFEIVLTYLQSAIIVEELLEKGIEANLLELLGDQGFWEYAHFAGLTLAVDVDLFGMRLSHAYLLSLWILVRLL